LKRNNDNIAKQAARRSGTPQDRLQLVRTKSENICMSCPCMSSVLRVQCFDYKKVPDRKHNALLIGQSILNICEIYERAIENIYPRWRANCDRSVILL